VVYQFFEKAKQMNMEQPYLAVMMGKFLVYTYLLALVLTFQLCITSAFVPKQHALSDRIVSIELKSNNGESDFITPDMGDVGFVLLAGGTGSRMKASMPKQYLPLRGVPVLHHSLDLFLEKLVDHCQSNACEGKSPPENVVLVMDPIYQNEYQKIVDRYPGRLEFANPGVERQGSVENGLNKLVEMSKGKCQFVAIHDSARPLVTIEEICNVVREAKEHGAAVLGVPCKATIKESEDGSFVQRTIPRSRLWEVHTPQVIRIETLLKGFQKVAKENLEVTGMYYK